MNQPQSDSDLDLYRENLRRELADLIERMDSHVIALATLALGTDLPGKKDRPPVSDCNAKPLRSE